MLIRNLIPLRLSNPLLYQGKMYTLGQSYVQGFCQEFQENKITTLTDSKAILTKILTPQEIINVNFHFSQDIYITQSFDMGWYHDSEEISLEEHLEKTDEEFSRWLVLLGREKALSAIKLLKG